MPYNAAQDIEEYFEKVRKTRECFLEGKDAEEFFHKIAHMYGADLNKSYSIKQLRELPKSKFSFSDELSKMRAQKYT